MPRSSSSMASNDDDSRGQNSFRTQKTNKSTGMSSINTADDTIVRRGDGAQIQKPPLWKAPSGLKLVKSRSDRESNYNSNQNTDEVEVNEIEVNSSIDDGDKYENDVLHLPASPYNDIQQNGLNGISNTEKSRYDCLCCILYCLCPRKGHDWKNRPMHV